MYKYSEIRTVHLEITQNCQAACPMCDRNENGGRDNRHLSYSELSLENCKKIFSPEFIAQLDTMYMCGNLGDPIIAKDTLEVFAYFREHNPSMWLSMNTNAGARDTKWWGELAKILGRNGAVIFSVDGLKDTNHLYRQNVVWDKVENSMKSFITNGGRARWDFIIFEHNQHQVEEAEEFSKLIGFEKFTKKKTARFFSTAKNHGKEEHQAVSRKGEYTVILRKPKEEFQNRALLKENVLIDQYGSMTEYYDSCKISCKVATKEKSIFVTAEGLLMPCCWTAGRMYKWWLPDPKTEQIWNIISKVGKQEIDLHINTLEHAINNSNLLQEIENSWSHKSTQDGKLIVCSQKCGTAFDAYAEQFK